MKIATALQIKHIDLTAINEYGMPGILLMENAAARVADVIRQTMPIHGKRCVILCGKGNNGGDGFAIARHLSGMGAVVYVAFFSCKDKLPPDAKINYNIAVAMGIALITTQKAFDIALNQCDFVVDSLYGIGFRGSFDNIDESLVNAINTSGKYVFAVDIPSGVNTDSGMIEGSAVKADKTVTFTVYKPAHFLFPAADYCGDIEVCDIAIPRQAIDKQQIRTQTIDIDDVAALLPRRTANSHKGTYGKVFAVAGSTGMSGAAYLAGVSAAKSGAGLVTLGVPESINDIIEKKTTEVMSLPLPDHQGALAKEASAKIIEKASVSDVLLFGPGLSAPQCIMPILNDILQNCTIPIIIDADGLNALAQNVSMLQNHKMPIIITPHSAEMSKLAGVSIDDVEQNRIQVAVDFASRYSVTVILKGAHTVVAGCDGDVYINTTGNAGMATGGSGDVLGGVTAALVAAGLGCVHAAICAVYLHGYAGDLAASRLGMESMLATDIMERLSDAFLSFGLSQSLSARTAFLDRCEK